MSTGIAQAAHDDRIEEAASAQVRRAVKLQRRGAVVCTGVLLALLVAIEAAQLRDMYHQDLASLDARFLDAYRRVQAELAPAEQTVRRAALLGQAHLAAPPQHGDHPGLEVRALQAPGGYTDLT